VTVLVAGFVENYMIRTYHGEKAPPLTENLIDEIIQDVEFNRLFDAYDDFDDAGGDDEDVGGGYGDAVDWGPSMVAVMIVVMTNLMTVIF
jgi:hypothetical protein